MVQDRLNLLSSGGGASEGGESTTMDKMVRAFDLQQPLRTQLGIVAPNPFQSRLAIQRHT